MKRVTAEFTVSFRVEHSCTKVYLFFIKLFQLCSAWFNC